MNEFVQNTRQMDIYQLLQANDIMSVKDLSTKLNVSLVTIRRDLDAMEANKLVKKFHGNVALNTSDAQQPKFYKDLGTNRQQKNAIAKVASSLVKAHDVISVDSSSSAYCIADQLSSGLSLKVITNQLITALRFASIPGVDVIQVGGLMHLETASTTDYLAVNFLKTFKTDIAFMTSYSFNMPAGAFDSIINLIEIKKTFIEITKRVVLLEDSSKLKKQAMCLSAPLEKVNTIITDEEAPVEVLEQVIDAGKELFIARISDGSILKHYNPLPDSFSK
jgi:DeoR/GlpR family transcriptional regulator of sugar metabolism